MTRTPSGQFTLNAAVIEQLHINFYPTPETDFSAINERLDRIMATSEQGVAALLVVEQRLLDVNARLQKIGAETESQKALIAELKALLEANDQLSPEMLSIIARIQEASERVELSAKVVDDKVPDAETKAG